MHDPLLRARKEALLDLEESMSEWEYEIALKAIDAYDDKIDYELEHAKKVVIEDTGHLIIETSEYDSNG